MKSWPTLQIVLQSVASFLHKARKESASFWLKWVSPLSNQAKRFIRNTDEKFDRWHSVSGDMLVLRCVEHIAGKLPRLNCPPKRNDNLESNFKPVNSRQLLMLSLYRLYSRLRRKKSSSRTLGLVQDALHSSEDILLNFTQSQSKKRCRK